MLKTTIIAATALFSQHVRSQDRREPTIPGSSSYNGLNLTPQMGWNNWNAYGCDIDEATVLRSARTLVDIGLRDLGYHYISLDDCWQNPRNATGYLEANPNKFPHGMKYVADKVHDMKMKFGMYSSAGIYTCAKYPASLGHEEKDAAFFAANDVDYLKYDNCYNQGQYGTPKLSFDRYDAMSKALNATGRPIVYALCSWGEDQVFGWAYYIANSGRMSGDIYDQFNRPDSRCPCTQSPCEWSGYHCSIMNILNKMAPIQSKTQPGYFNDMDGLEVGNGGQSDSEYKVHFSMWSLMSAPLIIGTDVTALTPASLSIYSNPAVIALNQDPTGTAAFRVWQKICDDVDQYGQCELAMWERTMDNGDVVLAFINAANSSTVMRTNLQEVFLDASTSGTSMPSPNIQKAWDVYDLWANRMNETEAAAILNGTAGDIDPMSSTRYNATAMPYAEGLAQNHTALMGKKIGTIQPNGDFATQLERHSIGLFRLRVGTPLKEDL